MPKDEAAIHCIVVETPAQDFESNDSMFVNRETK